MLVLLLWVPIRRTLGVLSQRAESILKEPKLIGLIGGMSWQSTLPYYEAINEGVAKRLGGLHSAPCLLWSVDFAAIEKMQVQGHWEEAGKYLGGIACKLEEAGVQGLLLCTNTMHKVAKQIESRVRVPLLHIADPTAKAIQAKGLKKIGLLATGFTMEQDFYRNYLTQNFRLEILVPEKADRDIVHQAIFSELCLGKIELESRKEFLRIVEQLIEKGAEGIILGCTEIGMLLKDGDACVPFFDTTQLHALAAVDFICS